MPWIRHTGLKMTGDCGETIEDRREDASSNRMKAQLAVWHRRRSSKER